jgi:hypothetical protein
MGLGNNRDYVKSERKIKCRLAVLAQRTKELTDTGMGYGTAFRQASAGLNAGELGDRLKAWVDPVLKHKREIRAARKAAEND